MEYWTKYLRTHIADSELSIIIAGNKLDEAKDKSLDVVKQYFTSLKSDLIYDFVLLSAQQVIHVDDLISVLQQKCQSLLLDKDRFTIPKLYKMTAESLQNTTSFLIGTHFLNLNIDRCNK